MCDWGLGFWDDAGIWCVEGLGFRVQGLGFWDDAGIWCVRGFGFGVQGLGFRV